MRRNSDTWIVLVIVITTSLVAGWCLGCITCWLTLSMPTADTLVEAATPTPFYVDAYQQDGSRPFEILDDYGDPFIRVGHSYVTVTLPRHISTWQLMESETYFDNPLEAYCVGERLTIPEVK